MDLSSMLRYKNTLQTARTSRERYNQPCTKWFMPRPGGYNYRSVQQEADLDLFPETTEVPSCLVNRRHFTWILNLSALE